MHLSAVSGLGSCSLLLIEHYQSSTSRWHRICGDVLRSDLLLLWAVDACLCQHACTEIRQSHIHPRSDMHSLKLPCHRLTHSLRRPAATVRHKWAAAAERTCRARSQVSRNTNVRRSRAPSPRARSCPLPIRDVWHPFYSMPVPLPGLARLSRGMHVSINFGRLRP